MLKISWKHRTRRSPVGVVGAACTCRKQCVSCLLDVVLNPLVLWNNNLNSKVSSCWGFDVPQLIVEARGFLHVVNCDHEDCYSKHTQTNDQQTLLAFLLDSVCCLRAGVLIKYARGVVNAFGVRWSQIEVVGCSKVAKLFSSAVLVKIEVELSQKEGAVGADGNFWCRRRVERDVTTVSVGIVLIIRSRLCLALLLAYASPLSYVVWDDTDAVKFTH